MKINRKGLSKLLALLLTLVMTMPMSGVSAYAPEGDAPPAYPTSLPTVSEAVYGDITPPAFAEGGYPTNNPQSPGSRQIYIYFKAQEPSYYHAVLLENDAIQPSKEQVMAGTDAADQAAIKAFGSKSMATDMAISGFVSQHGTEYDVYVVLKDDAGNLSEPEKVDFPSPPPSDYLVSGYPKTGAAQPDGSKQVEVKVSLQNINIESGKKGKVYWVLLPEGAARPSIEQVAAGTDGDDADAITSGSPEFSPGSEESFLVTGAAGNIQYDLYMVVGNTYYANPLGRCTDVVKLEVTTPADVEGEMLCEVVGGTEYATLQEAVEKAGPTATIRLLKSFTTVQGVIIDRKHITFDLNGYNLMIDTTANEGLKVNEGTVALTGAGELNISGKLYGVWANKSTVTVTNAAATDTDTSGSASGIGVCAITGSKVTVRGNAAGAAHGIKAENVYTEVTVNGDVSNGGQVKGAVYSAGQAAVLVKGNVTSPMGYGVHTYGGSITVEKNVSASHVGAMVEGADANIHIKGDLMSPNNGAVIVSDNGTITVDGEIKYSVSNPTVPGVSYVTIGSKKLAKGDGIPDFAKPGYLKYSTPPIETGIVWVKKQSMVCEIGSIQYDNLIEAIRAVNEDEVIKLLTDISIEKSVNIDGALPIRNKKFILDFDGHELYVTNPEGMGLNLWDAQVHVTGGGELKVNAKLAALYLNGSRFTSDSTVNVLLESSRNAGISTDRFAIVNIQKGEAKGGIYAKSNNTITLGGPVIAEGASDAEKAGIHLLGTGNKVSVDSVSVLSGSGYGIYMEGGGSVTVGGPTAPGNVIGKNSGIFTDQGSQRAYVTVYGDVEGGSHGIMVYDDAEIKVYGSVKSTSSNNAMWGVRSIAGITTSQSNLLEISGDVQGPNGLYVCGASGRANVTGSVTATGTASDSKGVEAAYGSCEIGGDVTAPNGIGADAGGKGEITIDGKLSGKVFAKVYYTIKTADDKTLPTTKPGYHTYSKDTAIVWVKESTSVPKHALIVVNGAGSGNYEEGTTVTITAVVAPDGQRFKEWSITPSVTFVESTSKTSQTAKFTMPAQPVTATAIYEALPVNTYSITVQDDGNGTASASVISAQAGTEITMTATPNIGYRFKEWRVISGGVNIVENKFTMPAENVTVKAIFEPIPAALYNVAVNGSYARTSGAGNYAQGTTVTINAGSRSNYSFAGWSSSGGVHLANASSSTTTFIMPDKDVTVTAAWRYSGGSSGSGESSGNKGGSASSAVPEQKPAARVLDSNKAVIKTIPITIDKSKGVVTVAPDSPSLTAAFDKSKADAQGVRTIKIDIPDMSGAKAYEAVLPASFFTSGNGKKRIEIKTGIASVEVPDNMLTDTEGMQKVSLIVATVDNGSLPEKIKKQINGGRVIDLSMKIDGKQILWNNEDVPVKAAIPYKPAGEVTSNLEHIVIYYIDGSGNTITIPNGRYNQAAGTMTFSSTRFGRYAAAYVYKTFDDLSMTEWARKAIETMASKGILTGTGINIYSPADNITRADYLAFLIKTLGLTASFEGNFEDVKPGAYYYEAIGVAKKLGIATGSGNNQFKPQESISRQDMMVLTARALEKFKKFKDIGDTSTLDGFSDKGDISGYAVESLAELVREGLITGSGNKLNPHSPVTRAEAAVFLYRIYNKY